MRMHEINEAKPPEVDPRVAAFFADVIGVLKANGFTGNAEFTDGRSAQMPYSGVLTQSEVDKLDRELRQVGMERSPATRALSWYNRNYNLLMSIDGKTGVEYHARLVKM